MSSPAADGLPLHVDAPTREERAMGLPEIVTRDEWIRTRVALLEREKALTKARDEVAAERRRLPMVEVTEDYRFTAADGSSRTLLDLFEGRHQLIVDHYMFDPDWEDGCMSCAGRVDQYGNTAHLHERDTTIAVVSRAPIEKIERWKHKMGWTFPWYSSYGSRFNFDYGVSFDKTVDDPHYNYRSAGAIVEAHGLAELPTELHGTSVLLRVDDRVFHTYSTYARGTEQVGGTHYYLDMTALGRQEDWEEPEGRATRSARVPTRRERGPRQESADAAVHQRVAGRADHIEATTLTGSSCSQPRASRSDQARRGTRASTNTGAAHHPRATCSSPKDGSSWRSVVGERERRQTTVERSCCSSKAGARSCATESALTSMERKPRQAEQLQAGAAAIRHSAGSGPKNHCEAWSPGVVRAGSRGGLARRAHGARSLCRWVFDGTRSHAPALSRGRRACRSRDGRVCGLDRTARWWWSGDAVGR